MEGFLRSGKAASGVRTVLIAAAVLMVVPLLMSVGPVGSFTVTTKQLGKGGSTSGSSSGTITYSAVPGMLRMDAEASGQSGSTAAHFSMIILFKPDQVVTIVLAPGQKKYAEQSQTPEAYLKDPNNIQTIFEEPSSAGGICHDPTATACQKIGSDIVLGRHVEKWSLTTKGQDGTTSSGTVWYDPELHFIIEAKNDDGSGFVPTKIVTEKPSPSLFRIPPGYTKY